MKDITIVTFISNNEKINEDFLHFTICVKIILMLKLLYLVTKVLT